MTLEYRNGAINFDFTEGEVQYEKATVHFPRRVNRATAALVGFNVRYKSGDHPTKAQKVDLSEVEVSSNTVTVTGALLLMDGTGVIDDAFGGRIEFVVIADLA